MNKEIRVEVNDTARPRKVTLHMTERDAYDGKVRRRRQFTVTERTFIAALTEAHIIAPWTAVNR